MAKKISHKCGFSLIEIIVMLGIFVALIQGAFFIGVPEYKRYVFDAEKNFYVDALLECRSQAMSSGQNCAVQGLVPGLADGFFSADGLFSTSDLDSTSTVVKISDGVNNDEISIDQNGFIDGR